MFCPSARHLLAFFAIFSCLFASAFAGVINPVAAQNGNKDRICLRACKFYSVDKSGSTISVTAMETSATFGFSSSATATVDSASAEVTSVDATGVPVVPSGVVAAAAPPVDATVKANGAFSAAAIPSFGLLAGAVGGLVLLL